MQNADVSTDGQLIARYPFFCFPRQRSRQPNLHFTVFYFAIHSKTALECPRFNLQHVEGENSMAKKNASALSSAIWFSISFYDMGVYKEAEDDRGSRKGQIK